MVVNLKPAKLMGVTSTGCFGGEVEVDGKQRLVLTTVGVRVTAGTKVS